MNHRLMPKLSSLLAPNNLGKLATKVPLRFNQKLVEFFLNKAFEEQIEDGDFEFLQGEELLIEFIDAKIFVGISFADNQLVCSYFDSVAINSTATLSINTYDAIQLIEQEIDPDTLFFQRKLKIRGNTELAHQAKNTIDTLDQSKIPSFIIKLANFYKNKFAKVTND